jgi:CheY-like chemotaxis protein
MTALDVGPILWAKGLYSHPGSAREAWVSSPNILVVDDDKAMVDLLCSLLRQGGYGVSTAHDAMQGLSAAHRLTPALIVLDINMPAGGGTAMLERLRRSTRTAQIPVLVFTATFQPRVFDSLLEKGANRVLPKPIDSATFLRTVDQLLRGSRAA